MADEVVILRELEKMLAAYPTQAAKYSDNQIAAMAEVWTESLDDLPNDLLRAACRNYRDQNEFLPAISEVRSSAVSLMRQASPARQTASEAWQDVTKAMARYGTYVAGVSIRRPPFENPITEAIVKRMGWNELCMDTGPQGVIRGQFLKLYDAEALRLEQKASQSMAVKEFIAAMAASPDRQLEPGNVQNVIAMLAEAKRV